MNSHCKYSWLPALALLCSLPAFTATVYKTIDENGVVSFSDIKPTQEILVETVVIDDRAAAPGGQEQQRLQDMRETTDRMVADRMAREKHRAELRQLEAKKVSQQPAQVASDYYEDAPMYPDYYNYPIRRPWRPPHHHPRPEHPVAHPPLRPHGIRPLPGNDYPASLIRKSYDPKVREAFR